MAALLDAAVAIRNLYMPESVMVSRLNLTCQVVAAYVPSSLILQHSLPMIVAFYQGTRISQTWESVLQFNNC
jgi:predicted transcriptional regulator